MIKLLKNSNASFNIFRPKQLGHTVLQFGKSFVHSVKELYNPSEPASKLQKYAGKSIIGLAAAITVLGVLNTIHINNKPSKVTETDVLDKNKESVVG